VWNGHDIDGILAMMTDHVIFEASFGGDPWGTRVVGKPTLRTLLQDMMERFPNVRWDEIRHFACSELAGFEWLTTGTPTGATPYKVEACDILTLRKGKTTSKRSYRTGAPTFPGCGSSTSRAEPARSTARPACTAARRRNG